MKDNKGITLTVLIVYIIAIVMTIAILSSISRSFYSNVNYITDKGKYISEFNKFNMYFIEDVKKNTKLYSISDNKIVFEDGTVYEYIQNEDKSIYRNKVKICREVEFCSFSEEENEETNKTIIKVDIYMNEDDLFELSTNYVLRYW